jgi:acetoin utilization deacetylase AcuC-like enzyme
MYHSKSVHGDADYNRAMRDLLVPVVTAFDLDLILLFAGYDVQTRGDACLHGGGPDDDHACAVAGAGILLTGGLRVELAPETTVGGSG